VFGVADGCVQLRIVPIPAVDNYLPARARVRYQPLFRALHRVALRGLGYGNGDPTTNGEVTLLRRMAKTWPSHPTIVDVGAHTGAWTSAVLAVAPRASIYALEPAAEPYRELVARVGNHSRTFQIGLSDEPGELPLWAPPNAREWASLYRRDLRQMDMTFEQGANVTLTTLDQFCTDQDIVRIHLLKLDAEGHELAILRGASHQLKARAIDAIQFEFGGTQLDSRTYLRDFSDICEAHGYRLWRLLRDGLVECDCSPAAEIFAYSNFVALRG
jgi:FkbM family methyltransferase